MGQAGLTASSLESQSLSRTTRGVWASAEEYKTKKTRLGMRRVGFNIYTGLKKLNQLNQLFLKLYTITLQ